MTTFYVHLPSVGASSELCALGSFLTEVIFQLQQTEPVSNISGEERLRVKMFEYQFKICTHPLNIVVEWLALLLCIWEVPLQILVQRLAILTGLP
jgi:hypothetical protein